MSKKSKGKIIAAFGIPGSGKSSTTKQIGDLLGIKTLLEPEAEHWGEAVKKRKTVGNFTALMWFRASRVPNYYKAKALKEDGKSVMIDSVYDKLFHLYMDKKGIEWLFDKDDLYYTEVKSIAKKDYLNLPDIDIIVFFKQTKENWRQFTKKRNRDLDNDKDFQNSFSLQAALLKAAKHYCERKNCILITHQQSFSCPNTEANKIIKKIKQHL